MLVDVKSLSKSVRCIMVKLSFKGGGGCGILAGGLRRIYCASVYGIPCELCITENGIERGIKGSLYDWQ